MNVQRVLIEIDNGRDPELIRHFVEVRQMISRMKTAGYEVDVVTDDFPKFMASLQGKFGNVVTRIVDERPPLHHPGFEDIVSALRACIVMFSEERYWESHVLLESVWRNSSGEMKEFLQGLIILAASQVHFQMGDKDIAEKQYSRAMQMLRGNSYSRRFTLQLEPEFSYPVELQLNA